MRESVSKSANIDNVDICEERETLGVTVLIRKVICHLHIALTDCLVPLPVSLSRGFHG